MLRMKNDRVVKHITLGWPVILEDQRKHRHTTADYYRITIQSVGLEYECNEDLVMDMIKWRSIVKGKRDKSMGTPDGREKINTERTR